MDKGEIIILAQIGILASLIYAFQIIFEFVENIIGLTGTVSLAAMIINPIIAAAIVAAAYSFWIEKPMPKIIRTYSVLLYVCIQFVNSNIKNGFDIQRVYGTVQTPLFYLALVLSIVIFTVMYFILTSVIDLVPKVVLAKKDPLKGKK